MLAIMPAGNETLTFLNGSSPIGRLIVVVPVVKPAAAVGDELMLIVGSNLPAGGQFVETT